MAQLTTLPNAPRYIGEVKKCAAGIAEIDRQMLKLMERRRQLMASLGAYADLVQHDLMLYPQADPLLKEAAQ